MSEDLSKDSNPPSPGRTPDEGIRMLADAEGLSRDEIVERMVASYWTLKEMDGMMDQLELDGMKGPSKDQATELESSLADALTHRLEELTDRVERVEDDNDTVERRVIEEFGHLRAILSYLIQKTDDLDTGQSIIQARAARDRRRETDEKQLIDLKRTASRHGVPRATCGHCGSPVDIGLLPTPDCPECRRRFSSLEPSKRWFGLGADVLTVADPPTPTGRQHETRVPDD